MEQIRRGLVGKEVLVDLINLIVLPSVSNPQVRTYETRKLEITVQEVSRILPVLSYGLFAELISKLDLQGDIFDAYVSRQISTLYFLLRLSPLYNGMDPKALFPEGVLENGPIASGNQLLINYLVESWNRYVNQGPTRNDLEAHSLERLYFLQLEVVRAYGWWVWPFFHHYGSSAHVDRMIELVENSDGCVPVPKRMDRGDMWSNVCREERGADPTSTEGSVRKPESPDPDKG